MLLMAAAARLMPGASVGSSRGKIFVNAPSVVALFVSLIGNLGLLITAAVMGKAIQRDFELRIASLFGTTPIGGGAYLEGRFTASLVVLVGIFSCIPLGLWAATLLPMAEAERLGPNRLTAYVWPILFVILPNLLITGSIFFSLGARLRRFGPVMTSAVLLLVGFLVAQQLVRNLDQRALAAIIEPFGGQALGEVTRYWTAEESNTLLIPVTGVLLWNRLLWLGLAAVISVATLWRFRFGTLGLKASRKPRKRDEPAQETLDVRSRGARAHASCTAGQWASPSQVRSDAQHVRYAPDP